MPNATKPDETNKAEWYCLLAQERLQSQEKLNAEHGTKAFWVFSLSVTMLAAGALLLKLLEFPLEGCDAYIIYGLSAGVLVSVLLAAGQSIQALGYKEWDKGPDMNVVQAYLSQHEPFVMFKLVGDAFIKAINTNETHLEAKAGHVRKAMIALLAEASILMVLGIFVVLVIT